MKELELVEVSNAIAARIKECKEMRLSLPDLVQKRSEKLREYDMAIEKSALTLKEQGKPTTLIPLILKGQCANKRFEYEIADGLLSTQNKCLGAIQTEIEGLRSIYSKLDYE